MRIILGLMFPLALVACGSNESPYGLYSEKVEVCFHSPDGFECEGEAENTVRVAPATGGGATVDLDLVFTNGHSCTAREAAGEWLEERLRVTVGSGAEACQFSLDFADESLTISDSADRPCRPAICGARGMLEGMTLPFTAPL